MRSRGRLPGRSAARPAARGGAGRRRRVLPTGSAGPERCFAGPALSLPTAAFGRRMLPGSECYTYTFHSRHDSADLIHPRSPRCHWPGVTSGWGGASAAPIHNPRRPAEAPARRGAGAGTPERTDGGRSASRPGVTHRRPLASRAGNAIWTRRAPEAREEGWGSGRQPRCSGCPGSPRAGNASPPGGRGPVPGEGCLKMEKRGETGWGLRGKRANERRSGYLSPHTLGPAEVPFFLVGFVFDI